MTTFVNESLCRTGYRLTFRGCWPRFALFCVVLIAFSTKAAAQVTSTIQGYISDPNGASVPQAKIGAINEETGVSRSTESAEDGYYRIPDLLAGTYRLTVEHAGFKTFIRRGISLSAKTVIGENVALELGAVTESVTVKEEGAQVETQVARINDTITAHEFETLPMLGRTPLSLVYTSPGITGKFESFGESQYCCDVFSTLNSPDVSSTGNNYKDEITVDGLGLRYGDGARWGMSFTPNPDAIQEVNVATGPYSTETGNLSGALVQLVTKGGTNTLHGTAHYTFQEAPTNAVPFGSTRDAIKGSYYRLFGATLGGPIKKDRLFWFFAYEGRRANKANSYIDLAETSQFKNFVETTKPNSFAAQLLKDFPPLHYPNQAIADVNGIPAIGEVTVDSPIKQGGRQLNGRIDYNFPNNTDRVYGSYWYTRPSQSGVALRPAFAINFFSRVNHVNVAHSHAFSPSILNEARFGDTETAADNRTSSGAYHVPGIFTDDGLSMGNFGWSLDVWQTHIREFGDTLSINQGKHGIKLGGGFASRWLGYQSYINNDTPAYEFASILDFANDNPYIETRDLDTLSGKANKTDARQGHRQLYFFAQNTWQVGPHLTLNYGLRWEDYFPPWLKQTGKQTWEPVLSSAQLTPDGIAHVVNQKVSQYANNYLKSFGPRIGLAWDPTGKGKLSIRGHFAILYDEVSATHMYEITGNPPGTATVEAGPQFGVPIVYGLAPVGTRDFPPNPNLPVPQLSPQGGFVGTRVGLAGYVRDMQIPRAYDSFVGVQYQLARNLMVFGNYRYYRVTNDAYAENLNRFEGDLLVNHGQLTRLNPNFNQILMWNNWGKRFYQGLIFGVTKRFSSGWSLDAHYTYNNAKSNWGRQHGDEVVADTTDPYKPDVDLARDDIAHVFTFRNVWELPILRHRSNWVGKAFGGWQLNSIWNFQSGPIFTPVSTASFGNGGDFNADGQQFDRPDKPTTNVSRSFSKSQWLQGTALRANMFPLPDPSQPRDGTLPRDYFRGPGYARIDLAAAKEVPIKERVRVQFRAEAFNALNRVNISGVGNRINRSNFGRVTDVYGMRVIQFQVKAVF